VEKEPLEMEVRFPFTAQCKVEGSCMSDLGVVERSRVTLSPEPVLNIVTVGPLIARVLLEGTA
jgi:hypothetical protein